MLKISQKLRTLKKTEEQKQLGVQENKKSHCFIKFLSKILLQMYKMTSQDLKILNLLILFNWPNKTRTKLNNKFKSNFFLLIVYVRQLEST